MSFISNCETLEAAASMCLSFKKEQNYLMQIVIWQVYHHS